MFFINRAVARSYAFVVLLSLEMNNSLYMLCLTGLSSYTVCPNHR